jgi:hypothetical protein
MDKYNHIQNRPKELHESEYYTSIPRIDIELSHKTLPLFLNVDLDEFFGIMPMTNEVIQLQQIFYGKPSEKEIDYYLSKKTSFQIVNVVVNIHTFVKECDNVIAYPYSISLIPAQKRGKPDDCSIKYIASMKLDKPSENNFVYSNFSPFKENDRGFYCDLALLSSPDLKIYTDTIGFVLKQYYLRADVALNDVGILTPPHLDRSIIAKYNKHRINRYFKPFQDLRPRKIWGCDSPIELFLIQALAQQGLFPVIQTLIFKTGEVYDNFYKMIQNGTFIKGDEMITEADLYFPENKLAVFCDSTKFHRGNKAKVKDQGINAALMEIGIKSVRFSGKEIIEDPMGCVDKIRILL